MTHFTLRASTCPYSEAVVRQKEAHDVAVGRAIRVIRTEHGMTRKGLAERSGLSYPYISEIETGKKSPSSKALRSIADAIGIPPHELLAAAETLAMGPRSWSSPSRRSFFHESEAMRTRAEPTEDFAMARLSMLDAAPPAPAAMPNAGPPAADDAQELLERFEALSGPDRELVLDFIRRLTEG